MSVAAVLLGVEPEELAPVVQAAGQALGEARRRIQGWQSEGPLKALSYAQIKAIAQETQGARGAITVSEPVQGARAGSVGASARASFEAGGSAIVHALARLEGASPARSSYEDRPPQSHGPTIR